MSVTLTPREVVDVLEGARQLIVQDGYDPRALGNHPYDWLKRPFKQKREAGKPWFLTSVLSFVAGGETLPAKWAGYRALQDALGETKIRDWQWEATIEDVLELFDKAIASLIC
jgi:hypothetical protein